MQNYFRNTKQGKYWIKLTDLGVNKALVNVDDASCILMMGIFNKEWDYLPSPGLMFCQTSSQAVFQMEAKKTNNRKHYRTTTIMLT